MRKLLIFVAVLLVSCAGGNKNDDDIMTQEIGDAVADDGLENDTLDIEDADSKDTEVAEVTEDIEDVEAKDTEVADAVDVEASDTDDAVEVEDAEPELACPKVLKPEAWGTLDKEDLDEASGIVTSRVHAGILWAHNDSGDTARFFAVNQTTGATVAEFTMEGITAIDFEDIAIGPFAGIDGDALFLADTGDNSVNRPNVVIHVVKEPVPGERPPVSVSVAASITLKYPDKPYDCESFFVDPETGDFYLVTKFSPKNDEGGKVFYAPASMLKTQEEVVLEEVATVQTFVATGADISADGSMIAIRWYMGGELFLRRPGQTIAQALSGDSCELPNQTTSYPGTNPEPQGEAIAFTPDGTGLITVSEYGNNDPNSQEIHFWKLDFGASAE